MSFKERTDVTAVPALGVVAETMVALVLADEATRKFGGDSVAELVAQPRRRSSPTLRERPGRWLTVRRVPCPAPRHVVLVGLMGVGQDDGRQEGRQAARPAVRRRRRRAATGAPAGRWPSGSPTASRRSGEAEADAAGRPARRRREPTVVAAGGGVVVTDANRRAAAAGPTSSSCGSQADPAFLASRAQRQGAPAAARRRPARHADRACTPSATAGTARWPTPWSRCARPTRPASKPEVARSPSRSSTRSAPTRRPERSGGDRARGPARRPLLPGARRRRRPAPAPRGAAGRASSGRRSSPSASSAVDVDPGVEHRVFTMGEGEDAKDLGTVEDLCRDCGPVGPHPRRRRRRGRRRRRHRHRRVRGGRLPPGRPGRARGHHAARPGRRRHRRQDRREPARGQEPGRRVLAAVGGAVRHRGARHPAAARVPQRPRRDGQVRLPRRRPPARPAARRGGGGVRALQGRGRRGRRARGRAAGRSSTTATRSPTRSRRPAATTCATARRSPSGWSTPPSWRTASAASTPTGSPSTAASSAGYDLPMTLPAGVDADELLALFARDKKAVDGVTFVLDGPRGVEPVRVDDRAAAGRHPGRRSDDGRAIATMSAPIVLLLSGPNLNLLGEREPEVYGTATLDDHVATAHGGGRARTGCELEHLQSNHEGELVEAIHGGPRPVRGDRDQPRCVHPLRLVDPRRARRVRRPGRRAAPVEPQRPRAVAPHVGGRAGGHRDHRRLRRRRLPAGGRGGRRPAGRRDDDLRPHSTRLAPMDVAGAVDRLRARLADAGCDALLVTKLVNIRYLTGFTGSAALLLVTADELLFVTDGRYGEQAADQLGAAGVDGHASRSTGTEQQDDRGAAATRPASAGSGSRPTPSRWAAQRAYADRLVPRRPSWCRPPGWSTACALVKDDGEVARIDGRGRHRRRRARRRSGPRLADRPTEAEFGLELDTEMRRLGRRRTSASRRSWRPGPTGPSPTTAPGRAGRSPRATSSCSTSAPWSTATART